jgi:hypothetical protein
MVPQLNGSTRRTGFPSLMASLVIDDVVENLPQGDE